MRKIEEVVDDAFEVCDFTFVQFWDEQGDRIRLDWNCPCMPRIGEKIVLYQGTVGTVKEVVYCPEKVLGWEDGEEMEIVIIQYSLETEIL